MSFRSTLPAYLLATISIVSAGALGACSPAPSSEITLKLNDAELELLSKALDTLPPDIATAALDQKISDQINAQLGDHPELAAKFRAATTVQDLPFGEVKP